MGGQNWFLGDEHDLRNIAYRRRCRRRRRCRDRDRAGGLMLGPGLGEGIRYYTRDSDWGLQYVGLGPGIGGGVWLR